MKAKTKAALIRCSLVAFEAVLMAAAAIVFIVKNK